MFNKKKRAIIIDEKRKRGSGYEHVYPMEINHREILRQETRPETMIFVYFFAGFSLLCLVIPLILMRLEHPDVAGITLVLVVMYGGLALMVGVIPLISEVKLQLDVGEGIITSLEGIVWVHYGVGNQRGERISKLEIDGTYLLLPKAQLGDFVNGQRYRVYYAPYTKLVVDSEPL